jgi:hypothetical protein
MSFLFILERRSKFAITHYEDGGFTYEKYDRRAFQKLSKYRCRDGEPLSEERKGIFPRTSDGEEGGVVSYDRDDSSDLAVFGCTRRLLRTVRARSVKTCLRCGESQDKTSEAQQGQMYFMGENGWKAQENDWELGFQESTKKKKKGDKKPTYGEPTEADLIHMDGTLLEGRRYLAWICRECQGQLRCRYAVGQGYNVSREEFWVRNASSQEVCLPDGLERVLVSKGILRLQGILRPFGNTSILRVKSLSLFIL